MPIEISAINSFQHFKLLQPATRQALSEFLYQKSYSEGQTLIIEGSTADYGFFLLSGALRVLRMNTKGRIQILARLEPGAMVNMISLLTPEKRNQATVEALSDSSILILHIQDFNHLLLHFPDFSEMLLRALAMRMALITDLAAGLSLHTVKMRLARFLIDSAESQEIAGGWTQDEIAAHIGTVRDVVGRLLRELEDEGLIQRDRQTIILLNQAGLSTLAED